MAAPAPNFTADNFLRVKALYDFDYLDEIDKSKIWMESGEIFYLLNKDGSEWWQVCRPDSPESPFYVPSTYVQVLTKVNDTSKQGHGSNNFVKQPSYSILKETVQKTMMSTFKSTDVNDDEDEDLYVNAPAKKVPEISETKDITVQYNSGSDTRPTTLAVEDDYVNLQQFREIAGIPPVYSTETDTSHSPKTPESEGDYANLRQLDLSEPTTPDIEHCEFQKTLLDTWDVYRDTITNRLFYSNKSTKEIQWKPPRGQFHEELHKKRSGGNSPGKSPSLDSESKTETPTVQGLTQGPRLGDRSQVSDRFAKSRSVMIESLHFNAPPVYTGPPPPKSATLPPNFSAPIHEDLEPIEGLLNKCSFSNGKKPSKKWAMMYVKLGGSNLVFYKDQKSTQPKPSQPYGKYESLVSLATCTVDKDTEKFTSKKNAICLSCPDSQILLQANDEQEMQEWFMKIHTRINELGGTPDAPNSAQPNSNALTPDTEKVSRKPSFKGHGRKPSSSGTLERKGKIKNVLERFMTTRSDKEKLIKKGIYRDAVFGGEIKQLCAKEKSKVPMFVVRAIDAIEKRGLEHEGLYRIGGNISQIQKLRCMVDQGEQYNLDDPMWDVNVLSGALKLFFRELKDPLFTSALFERFLKSFLLEKATERLKAIKSTVEELPKPNYESVKYLFRHLTNVSDLSKENKMAAHQLAIVFGPTLIWPEVQHQNLATSMVYQSRIVEFVLLEYKHIFR